MLLRLLLLFTIVPIVEIYLLIEIGQRIGALSTIGIVVATALIGAVLAKGQGTAAWRRLKQSLVGGGSPEEAMLNGVAVLVGATLLVTPGVLTDLFAIALLFPPTRGPMVRLAKGRVERRIREKGGEIEARYWHRDGEP